MAQITDELETCKAPNNKFLTRQKFILLISLLITIIILLCILIILLTNLSNYNENNRDVPSSSEETNNDIKSTSGQVQTLGNSHKVIYRDRWGGRKPLYERPQKTPVKYVIISHTSGSFCNTFKSCSQQMTQLQTLHVNARSPDIGYNFLIGGDANIYVGRGWDNHNFHMNLDTIGISFMGNYIFDELTAGMIDATHELLSEGVEKGKLEKDYILVGHNQTYNTHSPGENVYQQIKFWPHFSSEYLNDVEKQK